MLLKILRIDKISNEECRIGVIEEGGVWRNL